MRRTDARRRERHTPEGVTQGFQVSVYKVDPRLDSLACNLFSKDDWRPALGNEVVEGWPKVPLVSKPSARACRAERLAGATSCPDRPIIRPSGATQSQRPDANSSEEVALCISHKLIWLDVLNAALINYSGGDMARFDQVAQPVGGVWVNLVVIGRHGCNLRPQCAWLI
jgi:hypothetical protein